MLGAGAVALYDIMSHVRKLQKFISSAFSSSISSGTQQVCHSMGSVCIRVGGHGAINFCSDSRPPIAQHQNNRCFIRILMAL